MSLESDLADTFKRHGWVWKIKGHPDGIIPTEDDIEAALDEAARLLYNETVGTQLEIGRLIIKRKHDGFDVYIYAGPYQ